MPSAQEAREARRRKILARGSDRLAFIAGELPSISSPSLPAPVDPTGCGSDVPCAAPIPPSGDDALIRLTDRSPAEEPEVVPDSASSSVAEVEEFSSEQFGDNGSTRVIKSGHDEPTRALEEIQDFSELEERVANLNVSSRQTNKDVQLKPVHQNPYQKGTGSIKGGLLATSLLTWYRIAYSIDATQNFRAGGAFLLALVSILQSSLVCANLESKFFSNWALPWPVALVIVTDLSLVFGALLLGLMRTPTLTNNVDVPQASTAEEHLSMVSAMSSQLGCYLEVGAVFMKTSRALFLDCSIYLVTLISGYTLRQSWQQGFQVIINQLAAD